jgi:hypothetical protein
MWLACFRMSKLLGHWNQTFQTERKVAVYRGRIRNVMYFSEIDLSTAQIGSIRRTWFRCTWFYLDYVVIFVDIVIVREFGKMSRIFPIAFRSILARRFRRTFDAFLWALTLRLFFFVVLAVNDYFVQLSFWLFHFIVFFKLLK